MKVGIYVDNQRGYVQYDENTKEVLVTNSNKQIRWSVYRYLTTEHIFTLPKSSHLGDYMELSEKPIKNIGFFQLALCEMYNNIGVHVDWSDMGVEDGSIIDSLQGHDKYRIINKGE